MVRLKWTKAWSFVFLFLLVFMLKVTSLQAANNVNRDSNQPSVTAAAAVLMDVKTGDILFEKNARVRRAPASTTKIMTSILGLELGNPDEVVTVSSKAASVGESTIHLDPGEQITLYELITGALVRSGNDACVAIAEQIAGSEEQFVNLMNEKAKTLGAQDTHFVNTNGLPNKDHYSTAYDLALMARYGLQIPEFTSIIKLKETEIHFLEPDLFMDLKNTNKLLWSYPYADGVKTGTTNAAGKCLVASATKDNRKLVAVVLNAPNRFGDAQKLLEWGFNQTEIREMGQVGQAMGEFPISNSETLNGVLARDIEIAVPSDKLKDLKVHIVWERGPSLPIHAGEHLGRYEIWMGDNKLQMAELISDRDIKAQGFKPNRWPSMKSLFKSAS